MTGLSIQALEALLVRQEGVKLSAYRDSEGYWTIGVGRLIDAQKGGTISRAEAMFLLKNDIDRIIAGLYSRWPWIATLDEPRQIVLANMAYNIGIGGLALFTQTLAFVRDGDYGRAADAMLKSKWASQVKGRALELAQIMRTGTL